MLKITKIFCFFIFSNILFHRFPIITSQLFENNDCFEKMPKKIKNPNNSKKSSLNNNSDETTSKKESLNSSSSIEDDLMTKISYDISDELLEEIKNDRQEIPELDEYFDEDDLHQTSDANSEDNYQSQNIYQELSESAQQQLTNNPNNNELKIEIDNHFRNETESLEELLKINENFEISQGLSDELLETKTNSLEK
jgi:hypothetical protein